jgi:hypothetical protein
MKFTILLATVVVSFTASAAGTHKCDGLDSIGNLIGNTKSLGTAIKVAYVSTEEPAAAPDHVLVFIYDQEMGYSCTAISRNSDGGGFGSVNMSTLKTVSYDAKKGVLFSVQVVIANVEDAGKSQTETLRIRANQATGLVTLE